MTFALGTVQFGLPYGVANRQGQVSFEEAEAILELSKQEGIRTLDTAIAYGESEEVLGRLGVSGFQVITKLSEIPNGVNIANWVEEQVVLSRERLGIDRFYSIMLHRPEQLLSSRGPELYQVLQSLKRRGITEKVGISVYSPSELSKIYASMHFDLVQAPLNVLDRRMIHSGWLVRLQRMGVEIHIRSIFMQGLLLMSQNDRPEKFSPWQDLWRQWHVWLDEQNISALEACLAFGAHFPEIDKLVVGVDSVRQLRQILSVSPDLLPSLPDTLFSDDLALINPANWNQL
jgi:aryl-alcohol dehydrogenase-like predicted oxidoreductase